MKTLFAKLVAIAALAGSMVVQSGCAAIQHRNLETNVQMQQTIFLDPDKLDNRPVYVRVTNQTGKSDLNFDNLLVQKLKTKGVRVTKNPKEAGLRILANFVYLDKAKEGMTTDGAIAGGVGGVFVGGAATNTYAGAGLGGLAGAGIGALAGSLVQVDTWFGIVDIQVEEPLKGAATRKVRSGTDQSLRTMSASGQRNTRGSSVSIGTQGSSEDASMEYSETTNHNRLRTRIVAEAKQTNINIAEATQAIKEQLADAIANFM